MEPSFLDAAATLCFGLAILHTFLVKRLQHIGHSYPPGSVGENFFHLLGEVEVVFGLWAGLYLLILALSDGIKGPLRYLQERDFTEPAFVFVIMTVCSSRPILELAGRLIDFAARLLPLRRPVAFYFAALTVGPLLGSFITEPAAMTVTALILLERFYSRGISEKLMYATIGLLFVNVSIGGTLTPYAAPPILMVASQWDWGLGFMLTHFGWKGIVASTLSTAIATYRFRDELSKMKWDAPEKKERLPLWVALLHLFALVLIVAAAHYMALFIGIFMFFLGLVTVTKEYQHELKLREGLLVAFFLGGLVILGGPQRWWLEPILTKLSAAPLYLGAIGLTAITDNAALTYLGSQVPTLSEFSRYALVAGSVVGGGLTVIANAPNPAGYGILNSSFGKDGISPLSLFAHALVPTLTAAVMFWI